ncbi:MAG: Pectinesterase [Bacteroidetes bacterium ADurb.BinA395]|nr:MAG: Pectinesterase [Bacteroidetes bacterium ADurb.BinA395]
MKNGLMILLFFAFSLNLYSVNEIVVAKDGSGDFTTIQDAINSIPTSNNDWKTIVVKNGIYNEHVMIKSNYIALVGESRSGTRIEFSIPRAEWYAANGTNAGTGVINIASNLHDIVIANMYIRNTYEGSEDYTEVIRSETGTTHLWFINLDVLCLWKDTFAPWGKAGGMYYVSDCNFRGSIDAFCPRGYCYAINCRFTETKSSSPIWHEGVATEDQKLVIQGGSVHSEYNKNVKLQNCQNYAKFYYLDVQLSDSITQLGKSATTYFYGVKGPSGLTWFNNNLTLDERKLIDAEWTFDKKWNPERTMPRVLPFASLPQPYNGRYALSAGNLTLKWTSARNAVSNKVYFGTANQLQLLGETTLDSMITPVLETNKTYCWHVNTVTANGEMEGQLWFFSTGDNIDQSIDDNPTTPVEEDNTDYNSPRLNQYDTYLNCKTMPKEPAWIITSGSVNWSQGIGYYWGSSSAVLTLKVNNCTKIEFTYLNGSTSRPIIITDGGTNNDITTYPVAANTESTVTFIPKTTGDDDIQVKTSSASGLTLTKIVLYGIKSEIGKIVSASDTFFTLTSHFIQSDDLMDIFDISGEMVFEKVQHAKLLPGIYIVRSANRVKKILIK